nr:leucine-rich repeat protein [Tanacetum cinerariifolium]
MKNSDPSAKPSIQSSSLVEPFLSFCYWGGISCGKRHKRVTVLRLDSKGLEGSLSPHVGNLSFLRELSLGNNSFQGTIPHEVGCLSRLRRLYLHINKFSGVIPANLSRCSNLQDLWLSRNKLTGSIPKGTSLLSKLARLVIHDNKLIGGIPPFLGNITSMEMFSIFGNPFGGSIPDTLGLWKSLTTFGSVRDNELTGVLPSSISNCSKLGYLEMSNNKFSGKLTMDFSKLRDIYIIRLQYNNFHGRGQADDTRFIDSLKNSTHQLVDLELVSCILGQNPNQLGNPNPQAKWQLPVTATNDGYKTVIVEGTRLLVHSNHHDPSIVTIRYV